MDLSEKGRIKWQHALALGKKGEYREAERQLREALEDEPEHPLLKSSLARMYLRQNRLREARILSESVLSVNPEYPQALYVLGEIHVHEDDLEEALQYFRQAAQKDHRPYLIHSILKTLRRLGRYEEALETVESALIRERENPRLLKEKALVLDRMKRMDEALRAYERLQELEPDDAYITRAIYNLKSINRPEVEVISELQKVMALPSRRDNPQLHGFLGEKLKKAGRLGEAAAEYGQARELDPDNVYFLKQEGFCRYRLKEYPEAIHLLGEAFRKEPTDFRVKTTLSKLYSITCDTDGYISLLEEVLAEHPDNVKLMGTLKGLKKKRGLKEDHNA